nr:uncharacterized protein LOC127338555 [Lolium perenne]
MAAVSVQIDGRRHLSFGAFFGFRQVVLALPTEMAPKAGDALHRQLVKETRRATEAIARRPHLPPTRPSWRLELVHNPVSSAVELISNIRRARNWSPVLWPCLLDVVQCYSSRTRANRASLYAPNLSVWQCRKFTGR